ncbi:MAG TPA: cobalamin-independent methionine synthase II family protein [Acidimicrobiales bacterium]
MRPSTQKLRAETIGSLLQPEKLLRARQAAQSGAISFAELRAIEDIAVDEAISLQEEAGLDVVTDGEMRRPTWHDTSRHLLGLEPRGGERSYPSTAKGANSPGPDGRAILTVVDRISPKHDHPVGEEFPYLRVRATKPTKYTMAAPSYHRRNWVDHISTTAYDSCEEFLQDVRDWMNSVAHWLAAQGCGYIQLDAPNYGSLCDPATRQFHAEHGHDLESQIAFDAELDSSVFDGLEGVTSAIHVCRGNLPGGAWHSAGGYGVLADSLFRNLDVDVVLLEYDSGRAGDFSPISAIAAGTTVVLGLLTTKDAALETEKEIEARIAEASSVRPLDDLAISTQCGFASFTNAPMSNDQQRAKLDLVGTTARRVWG